MVKVNAPRISTASDFPRNNCGVRMRIQEIAPLSMCGSIILTEPEEKMPFQEPWQAQALAAALVLQDSGAVSPAEWSEALGAAIRRAQERGDADRGDTYYLHVVDALETILEAKQLVDGTELKQRKADWEQAYRVTPHGKPVSLKS